MSETPTPLPANPSLEQLQKRAKERLRELRAAAEPRPPSLTHSSQSPASMASTTWANLKHHIEALRPPGIEPFELLASDLAAAYTSGDEKIVRAINANLGTAFPTDFHDPDKVRQRMPTWYASETRSPGLAVIDARQMVAHAYGFENWAKFAASISQPRRRSALGAGLFEYPAALLHHRLEGESPLRARPANSQTLGTDLRHRRGTRHFETGSRRSHG